MNILTGVLDAMADHGMRPTDCTQIRMDGSLCRFDCEGDHHGKRNAWAVVFPDGQRPVVCFGHWSHGIHETVVLGGSKPMTAMEREHARMAMDAAKRDRETALARSRKYAKREAASSWQVSAPATAAHPYLARKGIKPDGLRVRGMALLVPMYDIDGALWNLQRIQPCGRKRFLRGGRVKDLFHLINNADCLGFPDEALLICEGYATGASLWQATGIPTAVCFSAGNMRNVGMLLRQKHPQAKLTFCADNDEKDDGSNVGLGAAKAAALAVGGHVCMPPDPGTDFNDFYLAGNAGADALREVVDHDSEK